METFISILNTITNHPVFLVVSVIFVFLPVFLLAIKIFAILKLKFLKWQLNKAYEKQVEKPFAHRLQKKFENVVSKNLSNPSILSSVLSAWVKSMLIPNAQDINRAMKIARKASQKDPTNGDAYIVLGMAYSLRADLENMQKNDSIKAMECFNEAISLSKKTYVADAYLYRCIAHINLNGDYRAANADYQQAINLAPRIRLRPYQMRITAFMFEDSGRVFYSNNSFDMAIVEFCKGIELYPDYASLYFNRGNVYKNKTKHLNTEFSIQIDDNFNQVSIHAEPNQTILHENKCDENINKAIMDYTEAINREPSFANAYRERAIMYGRKGDYANAIRDFDKALKISPYSVLTYKARGHVYICMKEFDKAINDFNELLNLKPDSIKTYYERGFVYLYKGEPDNAIMDFIEIIKNNQESANIYYACGISYLINMEYKNAINYFNKALKRNSNFASAYHFRGFVYYCKKDYDNAIKDYENALKLKPNDIYTYKSRGDAYYKKKNYNSAIIDYESALKLESNYAGVYGALAVVYYHIGHFDIAISNCNLELYRKPESFFIKGLRGLAYARKGDLNQAVIDINELLINPFISASELTRTIFFDPGIMLNIFNAIISHNPNSANALYGCSIAYKALKDKKNADIYFNLAKKINPALTLRGTA